VRPDCSAFQLGVECRQDEAVPCIGASPDHDTADNRHENAYQRSVQKTMLKMTAPQTDIHAMLRNRSSRGSASRTSSQVDGLFWHENSAICPPIACDPEAVHGDAESQPEQPYREDAVPHSAGTPPTNRSADPSTRRRRGYRRGVPPHSCDEAYRRRPGSQARTLFNDTFENVNGVPRQHWINISSAVITVARPASPLR
jgi:hypothetical protein